MKQVGLAPYILVSLLVHAGVLFGIGQLLKLPAEELESTKLIPVEVVVAREESPASEPELAYSDLIPPDSALPVKSQVVAKTPASPPVDTLAAPTPKPGEGEPSIPMARMATAGVIAEAPAGEEVESKPMLLASIFIPPQVSPVSPSMPAASARLAAKIPEILVETQTVHAPADSQRPAKVATPLSGNRPAVEPVFEMAPLASERHHEPRLTLNTNPALRDVPRVPEAETIASRPVILASQLFPAQIAPADPSTPSTSSLLDVKMTAVPIEAKAETISAHPGSLKKIETPLTSPLHRENPAAERNPPPSESTYKPVLMVSTLQFGSDPNGAQVYVDGMLSGITPLDMELPIGKHEVRLTLPKYYDWKAQIELTEKNQSLPIFFRLLPVESSN